MAAAAPAVKVDFNNALVTTAVAFGGFAGFPVVADASLDIHGTINVANFGSGGFSELLLKDFRR